MDAQPFRSSHKRKSPHPRAQIRHRPRPRPYDSGRGRRPAPPPSLLPRFARRQMGLRWFPGSPGPTKASLYGKTPRPPDTRAPAFRRHPSRSHASRALVKPLPLRDAARPSAAPKQAKTPHRPGDPGQSGSSLVLTPWLKPLGGLPLQSLVLLPPLQRPMLPLALLPLMRHGGRGPWGSGRRLCALARRNYIYGREEEKMATASQARLLYRLCFCEDASQATSFRRRHVTRASSPRIVIYPTPRPFPNFPLLCLGHTSEERISCFFYLRPQEKGVLLYKAFKIKESL